MDDFPGLLARDFGFKPQGKSAPMAAAKSGNGTGMNFGAGSGSDRGSKGKSTWNSTPSANSLFDDGIFGPSASQKSPPSQDFGGLGGYDDVFGGVSRYKSNSETQASSPPPPSVDYDSIFHGSKSSSNNNSVPVYDKPVYDDDIFDGVPGLKSSSSVEYDDVFASFYPAPTSHDHFDGLLGKIGKVDLDSKGSSKKMKESTRNVADFDDLIPGFGGTNPNKGDDLNKRASSKSTVTSSRTGSIMSEDPFVVLESSSIPINPPSGLFTDSSEYIGKSSNTVRNKYEDSTGENFDNFDVFGGFTRPEGNKKEMSPPRAGKGKSSESSSGIGASERHPMNTSEHARHKKGSSDVLQEPHEVTFDKTTRSSELDEAAGKSNFNAVNPNIHLYDMNSQEDLSAKFSDGIKSTNEIWLTVSEIPLLTLPTSAPPPSRPPPLSNRWKNLNMEKSSVGDLNLNQKVNEFSSFSQSTKTRLNSKPPTEPDKSFGTSATAIDEIEDFAMGRTRMNPENRSDSFSSEEDQETNSTAAASAAAMKEAMDKAEAKFKHAKELRERESNAKASKTRDFSQDSIEREQRERQDRLDHEREQREKEEYERVKRLEKEREDRERERARQAVERATREARERAEAEAKERAASEARKRAERAAVEKANAEARERAERAAVQRVTQEARERAAAEARERVVKAAAEKAAAEKAAAERAAAERAAKERAVLEKAREEARLRAERVAVERVAAEVRERATAAAAAAAKKQQRNDNDLESFFDMGVRANSAPRQRSSTIDPFFDAQSQGWGNPDSARASSGISSTIRKSSSSTNIVDDLTSIFGAPASSGEFQEVDGESEERRRARLERHQRTLERAAKALAEKNERDIQTQREQAERHRIGETLDIEIKRWAAGKEGNIRALLSTLQYVLWPECGWQPASLTDLITAASVKKVYRKATLCIHPDKVQQKGANLQQKYIAEKVFDLLKEAWNKFNSEELF